MKHHLMNNNITFDDNKKVINFLKTNPRLTNGKKVIDFEKRWSKWLGVKYSVFVNSGTSSNIISLAYLKTKYTQGEIIVPALTWVSDITSILYNNFKPVFVDINLNNLGAAFDKIEKAVNKNTRAIFLTHVLGFNSLSDKLLKLIKKKKIFLIEDVCESHGALHKNKKLGTFGNISNFSFYYAHHMSTIEGGMVCTNDKEIYNTIRILRSHGMLRESNDKKFKNKFINLNKKLNKEFLFLYPGYNFRSTEINAIYGINQLKRLDSNNKKRNRNFKFFLDNLDKNLFYTKFDLVGSSNYAFTILFNEKYRNKYFRAKFEKKLGSYGIEFRRGMAGGGNQTMQPYLSSYKKKYRIFKTLKNTNIIHDYGYYIGNYPDLDKNKIKKICNILNAL
tara:strand:- start:7194 stop:8366 length:1173 start_codon:yes stop_codon:yes gene_type:complete